jgi:predicted Zn-ribbon and HTH transcriptional regulator
MARNAPDSVEATSTRRRQIIDLLEQGEWGFDELRRELETSVRALEDDLRHVELSLKHGGSRLWVEPARCLGCGFKFQDRAPRRFHAPSRCPKCRSERIAEPRLRVS